MPIEILHVSSEKSLDRASEEIFGLLGVGSYREHESDNYPGGSYFRGVKGGLTVEVSPEDDFGYDEYQYWVVVSSDPELGRGVRAEAEAIAAELLRAGFAVCRGPGPDEEPETREVYSLGPAGQLVKRREPVPSP